VAGRFNKPVLPMEQSASESSNDNHIAAPMLAEI